MERVIKEVLNKLNTAVPELRSIDSDEGQLDVSENNYPVFFPAVLIDVDSVDWTTTEWDKQTGNATLIIRYAFNSPNKFSNNTSETRLNDTIERWALAKKISKALHGFKGNGFGPLERIRTEREQRDGVLKVLVILFSFNMDELLS